MNYLDYLRTDKFPHFWCSGCGNGIVLCAIARAFEELDLTLENTVVVTGIGCWGKADDLCPHQQLPRHTRPGPWLLPPGIKLAILP